MKVNLDLNDIASKVDHWQRFNRYLVLEAAEIARESARKEALELGCGSGVTTGVYLQNFKHVTVVDGSSLYLKRAKERHGKFRNADYICSYFEDLKLPNKYEDVIMTHILEHVENPVDILRKAAGWLKPGGKMHIVVPNGTSLHRLVGVELGMLKEADELPEAEAARGHRRVYTMPKLKRDVKKAGLRIAKARGFLVKTFPDDVLKVIREDYVDALFRVSDKVSPEICADLYVVCQKPAAGGKGKQQ